MRPSAGAAAGLIRRSALKQIGPNRHRNLADTSSVLSKPPGKNRDWLRLRDHGAQAEQRVWALGTADLCEASNSAEQRGALGRLGTSNLCEASSPSSSCNSAGVPLILMPLMDPLMGRLEVRGRAAARHQKRRKGTVHVGEGFSEGPRRIKRQRCQHKTLRGNCAAKAGPTALRHYVDVSMSCR